MRRDSLPLFTYTTLSGNILLHLANVVKVGSVGISYAKMQKSYPPPDNQLQVCNVTVADLRFPEGGTSNLLFDQICPENCINMKESGPGLGAYPWRPLDLPMHYHFEKVRVLQSHVFNLWTFQAW